MARRTFRARISTPRSTAASAPQSTTVALARGTLERLWIVVPSGHAGLTGVALQDAEEHIFPWGPGSWLEGDEEVVEVRLDYELSGSSIVVRTYNEDDTYSHDHLLRFQILDPAGRVGRIVRPLDLAPTDLDIPTEGNTDEGMPIVGDELVGVTPEGGEVIEP
ncbi:hypothetical protein LCGC14_1139420 [marine sediment metagenome]|uniref:Uncharacterized protein n=1 Tax=marine sediment metagenome TaxID=412755 RepID=A0A0F9PGZ3_9ZZZZ